MVAFRVRKVETIEFSIVADSEDEVKDYLYYNNIQSIVDGAEKNNQTILVDEDEEIITPIMENSICEINICKE